MRHLTILLLTAASIHAANGQLEPKDYEQIAAKAKWTWSDDKASLGYCVKTFHATQDGDKVRIVKGDREAYQFAADDLETVFALEGDQLFIIFSPGHCGCGVTAVDLKTGKKLWTAGLKHAGPAARRVNIETDGKAVTVWVNESVGRHLEILDAKTGKMLASRVFRDEQGRTAMRQAVTVLGNESDGRYIEILVAKTGKTVGHKVFEE